MRIIVTLILLVLLAFAAFVLYSEINLMSETSLNESSDPEAVETEQTEQSEGMEEGMNIPGAEEAELTGFQFMQDFVAISSEENDSLATTRILNTLSLRASSKISSSTIEADLLEFIKVDTAPSLGVSVEDLLVDGTQAVLTVGLNYENDRPLRNIHLVVEEEEWKVDDVSVASDI